MAKYAKAIECAAELWEGCDYDDVVQNEEYMNGIVQVISKMFNRDTEEGHDVIRNEILDYAGIYRDVPWDGVRTPLIESETNPWIQDASGTAYDFGLNGDLFRELAPGVLVTYTHIQRDDAADDAPASDLHAAWIAADLVTRVTGRQHTVWFRGTY